MWACPASLGPVGFWQSNVPIDTCRGMSDAKNVALGQVSLLASKQYNYGSLYQFQNYFPGTSRFTSHYGSSAHYNTTEQLDTPRRTNWFRSVVTRSKVRGRYQQMNPAFLDPHHQQIVEIFGLKDTLFICGLLFIHMNIRAPLHATLGLYILLYRCTLFWPTNTWAACLYIQIYKPAANLIFGKPKCASVPKYMTGRAKIFYKTVAAVVQHCIACVSKQINR